MTGLDGSDGRRPAAVVVALVAIAALGWGAGVLGAASARPAIRTTAIGQPTSMAATTERSGKSMNGLEELRKAIDEMLWRQADVKVRRRGFVHLYGVADACVLLALRRGLDPQTAAAAGMLHDISACETGDMTDHCARSAETAQRMLEAAGGFSPDQVEQICQAIRVHDDKDDIGGPLDEVLKDADLLAPYLYNPALKAGKPKHARLVAALAELGIAP